MARTGDYQGPVKREDWIRYLRARISALRFDIAAISLLKKATAPLYINALKRDILLANGQLAAVEEGSYIPRGLERFEL